MPPALPGKIFTQISKCFSFQAPPAFPAVNLFWKCKNTFWYRLQKHWLQRWSYTQKAAPPEWER